MYGTTTPHTPFVPLKEFQGTTEAGTYGDLISQTDHAIGQVITALKEAGLYENTLVILSSDNGPAPFVRQTIQTHGHNPSGELRGQKRDSLEGGHRVPFIVHWPEGGLSGGREVKSIISQADLFATIAGITGAELGEGVAEDSLDIMPSLKDDTAVRAELVYHSARAKLGLRQGDWAYLRKGGISEEPDWFTEMRESDLSQEPYLLFDLSKDLEQKTTLHEQYQERVQQMEAKLAEVERSKQTR